MTKLSDVVPSNKSEIKKERVIISNAWEVVEKASRLTDAMEFLQTPMFAQGTQPEIKIKNWTSPDKKRSLEIIPFVLGRATIHDADISMYMITAIASLANKNLISRKSMTSIMYGLDMPIIQLFKFRNRTSVGGDNYKDLIASLDRLKGTSFTITVGDVVRNGSLIQDYETPLKNGVRENITIVPSEFLLSMIVDPKKLLVVDKKYLELRGGRERQLYRMCRSMCRKKPSMSISVESAWIWCGESGQLPVFRNWIIKFIKSYDKSIPEYYLRYVKKTDTLIILNSRAMGKKHMIEKLRNEKNEYLRQNNLEAINADKIEEYKKRIINEEITYEDAILAEDLNYYHYPDEF